MSKELENWKIVPGFPKYEISDHGRVRSMHTHAPKILSTPPNSSGYPHGELRHDGKKMCFLLHRLVLETFIGSAPEGFEGAHLNGNRLNCRLDNLRWCSAKENNAHKATHGTLLRGSGVGNSKLHEIQVIQIKKMLHDGRSVSSLARQFGVCIGSISLIKLKKNWPHIDLDGILCLPPEHQPKAIASLIWNFATDRALGVLASNRRFFENDADYELVAASVRGNRNE